MCLCGLRAKEERGPPREAAGMSARCVPCVLLENATGPALFFFGARSVAVANLREMGWIRKPSNEQPCVTLATCLILPDRYVRLTKVYENVWGGE